MEPGRHELIHGVELADIPEPTRSRDEWCHSAVGGFVILAVGYAVARKLTRASGTAP